MVSVFERTHHRAKGLLRGYYGCSVPKEMVVYFNIKIAPCQTHLKDTIAHELMHLKYEDKEDHTKKFYKLIEKTLKKG